MYPLNTHNQRRKQGVDKAFFLTSTLSAMAAATGLTGLFIVYFFLVIAITAMTRGFRGRENCSIFALVAVTAIPANLRIVIAALCTEIMGIITRGNIVFVALWGILIYAVLFSFEQIVFALIVRVFWPTQHYYAEKPNTAND